MLELNCNLNKTFFIVSQDSLVKNTKANETISFNFLIIPVAQNINYLVTSWGLFDINETLINNLDYVYNYSISLTMPAIPEGVYQQVFEVSNGLQTQYITYEINNTQTLTPIIMKFTYPEKVTYGRYYNVSLLAKNVNSASIEVSGLNFALVNVSEYYWEGRFYVTNSTNNITLKVENPFSNLEQTYNLTVEDLDFSIANIILPAVAVNQSSNILLVDFGVDIPIPVSVDAYPVLGVNETQTFDFYITDEAGRTSPTTAKKLYLILSPKQPVKSTLGINITSPYFSQKVINVEFLGSQITYSPEVTFTYYDKQTHCKLIGDNLLNSSYRCEFSLPYNINPNNLQSTELEMLKMAYETKIDYLNKSIGNLEFQRLIILVILIIIIIGLVVYFLKDKIMLLR
jgi:hypothetical protein